MGIYTGEYISGIEVSDIRFPTSLQGDGSDAMHTDPDYSCAYVVISTSHQNRGYGLTFTIGKGTEIVVAAVKALFPLIKGKMLDDIFVDFGRLWRAITSDSQLRWIGPEKGVVHLATSAVVNALWDLWARKEGKPLWKLLTDMDPETLVSTIDFRYITDAITKEEAVELLKKKQGTRDSREKEMINTGYPAYCTSVGWIGYSEEKIKQLCREKKAEGFTNCNEDFIPEGRRFKAKVGLNLDSDKKRLQVIRKEIGEDSVLMVDANQKWEVQEAIAWMKELAMFKPLWIEEPTSPDDILGHKAIAEELNPIGIGVATGEQCHNRVMFKQFLQANAMQYCQIDCCRLGGVSEVMAVYLMAAKFSVPVCPHAGGVGLCELVQHLAIWDYICLSGSLDNRMVEYVEHLHEHFKTPIVVENGRYRVPQTPGYSSEMKEDSVTAYEYPRGSVWKELFQCQKYEEPTMV